MSTLSVSITTSCVNIVVNYVSPSGGVDVRSACDRVRFGRSRRPKLVSHPVESGAAPWSCCCPLLFWEDSLGERAAEPAGARTGQREQTWWSTWWPFGLAWPATAAAIVLGSWAGYALDSRLLTVALFPYAAAVSTTELRRFGAVALALFSQLPLYALIARVAVRRQHSRAAMPAIVALHLAGIALGSPLSWGPSLPGFGRTLARAAGPAARDCGCVPLAGDRTAAVRCSRAALAAGQPFFVAFQVMGIDSTIYTGLAYRGPGQATRIVWDSDITGGSNLVPIRRIHQSPCPSPTIRVAESASPIACVEPGDAPPP